MCKPLFHDLTLNNGYRATRDDIKIQYKYDPDHLKRNRVADDSKPM